MTGFKNVSYDDRDTDHIRYNNLWFVTGAWNASSVGETGTLSSSDATTANLTFTFPEKATGFYYYGIPRCCGGFYAICIDCDPNNPNFIPIDGVNPNDDGENPPVVLFSMTFAEPGVHEIVLKNQNDTRFGKSQITLDRFDLQVVDPNAPDTTLATTYAAPTLSSITASSTAKVAASGSTKSSTPVGAIIGGVLGGIFLVAVLIFLFILLARRRRKDYPAPLDPQFHYDTPAPATDSFPVLTPYHGPMRQNTMSSTVTGSTAPLRQSMGKRHYQHPSVSETTTSNAYTSTSFASSSRVPRRETDAGRVPVEDEDEYEDNPTLPPEYEQVFTRGRVTSGSTEFESVSGSSSGSASRSGISQRPPDVPAGKSGFI